MTVWTKGNKFVKIWKDEGNLKVGFFNSDNVLLDEVPLKDLNSSNPVEIAKEIAESHNIRVQAGHGVEFDTIQGNWRSIEQKTNLSNREAELYVLTEELGYSREQAAKEMGISTGNLDGKRGNIKEKIRKAEKTAELSI